MNVYKFTIWNTSNGFGYGQHQQIIIVNLWDKL